MNKNKLLIIIYMILICFFVSAKENQITKYKLNNDIPVFIKKTEDSRIVALRIVVKGGIVNIPKEYSGLEQIVFAMMTRGSRNYSYSEIQSLSYKTKSNLFSSSGECGSMLGFSCIDHYFETMYSLLEDGFIYPLFSKEEYKNLINENKQNLQSIKNNPSQLLDYTLATECTKGTAFETNVGYTEESLPNLTLERIKTFYKTILDSKKIAIVAVGNFDEDKLINRLNSSFGNIQSSSKELSILKPYSIDIKGEPIILTHPVSSGTGFIVNAFKSPTPYDEDYMPTLIAASMFQDVLFNIVREKYGACYSPYCSVFGTGSGGAYFGFYRVSNLYNIVNYSKEALDIILQGNVILGKNDDGSFKYDTIDNRIESYINKILNGCYEGLQTNNGNCYNMSSSYLKYGDPEAYLKRIESIRYITAQQVKDVLNKYWTQTNSRWFAVVGPENETFNFN